MLDILKTSVSESKAKQTSSNLPQTACASHPCDAMRRDATLRLEWIELDFTSIGLTVKKAIPALKVS